LCSMRHCKILLALFAGRSRLSICVRFVCCCWLVLVACLSFREWQATETHLLSLKLQQNLQQPSASVSWGCNELSKAYSMGRMGRMRVSSGGNKDIFLSMWGKSEVVIKEFRWVSWATILNPITSYR
jgi:hypothetical protein